MQFSTLIKIGGFIREGFIFFAYSGEQRQVPIFGITTTIQHTKNKSDFDKMFFFSYYLGNWGRYQISFNGTMFGTSNTVLHIKKRLVLRSGDYVGFAILFLGILLLFFFIFFLRHNVADIQHNSAQSLVWERGWAK